MSEKTIKEENEQALILNTCHWPPSFRLLTRG